MTLLIGVVIGVGLGLFLAREWRLYCFVNRRGGEIDLTGRRL